MVVPVFAGETEDAAEPFMGSVAPIAADSRAAPPAGADPEGPDPDGEPGPSPGRELSLPSALDGPDAPRPEDPAGTSELRFTETVLPHAVTSAAVSSAVAIRRLPTMARLEVAQEGRRDAGHVGGVEHLEGHRGRVARVVQPLDHVEHVARDAPVDRDGADDLGLIQRDVQPRAVRHPVHERVGQAVDLAANRGDTWGAGSDRGERV